MLVKKILARFDVELEVIDGGQSAIVPITDSPEAYDLVLLDWEMLVLDGADVLDIITTLGI